MAQSSTGGFGRFFKGFGSGLFSGGVMMAITGVVTLVTGITLFPGFLAAGGVMLTTGLFSGTMSTIKGKKSEATPAIVGTGARGAQITEYSNTPSQGLSQSQDIAQEQPSSNWANKVGGPRQSRVQDILNRDMSDKSRAEAILAERENATGTGLGV